MGFLLLFVVIVNACRQVSRDTQDTIQPHPKTFPSGIQALTDYVHSRKLKFGIYSGPEKDHICLFIIHTLIVFLAALDRGICLGGPGSLGYEIKYANTYAAWRVDFLKFDSCFADGISAGPGYSVMRDALNATGRPIFYSLCGMYTSLSTLFGIFFDFFKSKLVLQNTIFGHRVLQTVGEQLMTFKIIGLQ